MVQFMLKSLLTLFSSTHRYRPEIPELTPSLSWHGAQIGGIRVFLKIKITTIHQVCVCCGLRKKIYMPKMPYGSKIVGAFVSACVWSAKAKYPHFELHGWRRHYTGWYRSSGISFLYLWSNHKPSTYPPARLWPCGKMLHKIHPYPEYRDFCGSYVFGNLCKHLIATLILKHLPNEGSKQYRWKIHFTHSQTSYNWKGLKMIWIMIKPPKTFLVLIQQTTLYLPTQKCLYS